MDDDMTPEEKEAWMRQRIRQLRNQLDEISGGEAVFGTSAEPEDPDALAVELQFLEQVVGFETAPQTTWRNKLREAGYEMPPPDSLDDEAVSLEVWDVIQRLAELRAYLDGTNHLSDRELYEKLYEHVDHPVMDVYLDEGSAYHFEMLAAGVEEDDQLYLRYYADEKDRKMWREEFGVELPPKEDPPHDRDRLLPQREFPESPELIFARGLAETAWEDDENGPMRLSGELRAEELEHVLLYQLARTLLETLGARGKVKATAARGMLPRKFVREVLEVQPFPIERVAGDHEWISVADEDKYPRLHFARLACGQAGLLRKYNGAFQLTKKGARSLAAPKAGALYRELFRVAFSKLNLAAFDRLPAYDWLQYGLPVVLLRLWEEDDEWVALDETPMAYLLPEPYFQLLSESDEPETQAFHFWCRILRWLDDFGLIDTVRGEKKGIIFDGPDAVRISDLGRKFLEFDTPSFDPPEFGPPGGDCPF